jgi:dienelactone hydrolase
MNQRRSRRSIRRSAAVAVAALLGAVACSTTGATSVPKSVASTSTTAVVSTAPTSASPTKAGRTGDVHDAGSFAVGSRQVTVVDDSRSTDAWGGRQELPQRTLPTQVLYPAEGDADSTEVTPDATPADGRWPLVVFSHGRGGTGPAYVNTLKVWASAGYVVLAPTFPLTSAETPGTPKTDDLVNQPADVSRLIDWATEPPAEEPLARHIDTEQIGVAGHSLGGFTSLAVGYNPKVRDDRADAVAEWAGSYLPGLADGGAAVQDGPPLLAIHGDADGTVPYALAQNAVDAVGSPWHLITLVGGEHIPPYVTGTADPYGEVVTDATLAFFDATLKTDPAGDARLERVVSQAGTDVAILNTEE